jgi:hypothetical protein
MQTQSARSLDTMESLERTFVDALDTDGTDPRLTELLGGMQGARFVIGDERPSDEYRRERDAVECAANPANTGTTYTTEWAGVTSYESVGYRLDGIEGYIYPKTMSPQPAGTVRLMRKYNAARDDHAIFPETLLTQMANLGYTLDSGSDSLGYVYASPSDGSTPTIQ